MITRMASTKRKTLPRDFEALLAAGDLDAVKRVFDRCLPDATTGYSKHTALAFDACPEELTRWLVARGADVNARDTYRRTPLFERVSGAGIQLLVDLGAEVDAFDYQGETPLHHAAKYGRLDAVRVLLRCGADLHVRDRQSRTPLGVALARCSNIQIVATVAVAELLLGVGSTVDETMRERVREIGESFEFFREKFNPVHLDETDAALTRLYTLFAVEPVPLLIRHDGLARIEVASGPWRGQYDALWKLLVPPSGAASTIQGEAIRICGRLGHEILGNGGVNWDADFRRMCAALPAHLGSGTSLPPAELQEAAGLARSVRTGSGEAGELSRLTELTVRWVQLNPVPVPHNGPAYLR
jgi:hypothetical protein